MIGKQLTNKQEIDISRAQWLRNEANAVCGVLYGNRPTAYINSVVSHLVSCR